MMTNTNTAILTTVRKYAASVGVEFEAGRSAGEWSVECYAPEGKVWRAHGTHFLALPADGFYGTPNWSETLATLRSEVEYGFEDCTDSDCETCG